MKIVICGFGNPNNRGCEAIVRTTTKMIKDVFPHSKIIATSNDFGRVKMLDLSTVDHYEKSYYPHEDTFDSYIYAGICRVFGTSYLWSYIKNINAYRKIGKADICISVGGDNFCYNNRIDHFLVHHNHFKRNGAKMIHWGTSFEKELMSPKLINDLNKFNAIMVRESISYETLKEAGIGVPIYLVPDPAFTMDAVKPHDDLPIEEDSVGLNISSMVIGKESCCDIVRRNTVNLINYIIDQGKQVVLIPHVADRKTGSGDYSVMQDILKEVKQPERCLCVGYGYSAPELKYIISKCQLFIGARTHATIAAYSMCVPTIAIGYSVKAIGISKDIFGNTDKYVIPVQTIDKDDTLVNSFQWLTKHKDEIQYNLVKIMPEYIAKAKEAENVILDVVGRDEL